MKTERYKLEDALNEAMPRLVFYREVVDKVIEVFNRKKLSKAKAMQILNKNLAIQTVSDIELYLITKILYETSDKEKENINPNKYFNESEIRVADNFINTEENEFDTELLEFNNINQITDYQYGCVALTYQQIAKMFNAGWIRYNFATQRETTRKVASGKIIESITLNPKAVKQITEKMLQGKFTANMITFNILATGEERFEYDVKSKTLKIARENTNIDCLDGYHRLTAAVKAVQVDPNIQGSLFVNILNYTEREAQDYIIQEDHKTPISKQHITNISSDINMLLANKINRFGTEEINLLFNKLGRDMNEVKFLSKYSTLETFADAIKNNFSADARSSRKIEEFLINGFNEIIGMRLKEFNNLDETRESTMIADNNTFIGYIALLSELYGRADWEDKLIEAIISIDVSRENKIWDDIGLFNSSLNKTTIKKISNYFKELVK